MAPPPFGCPASSLLERPLGFASPPRDGFAFIAAPVALARMYPSLVTYGWRRMGHMAHLLRGN